MVRWPAKIEARSVSNQSMHHMDWLPTFLAMVGDPSIKEKLKQKKKRRQKGFRVHLDGYNFLPFLTSQEDKGPRKELFCLSDDGDLSALRYDDWKAVFMEQKTEGTFRVWMDPFVPLRVPLIFNLRRDPCERAEVNSNTCCDWMIDRTFMLYGAQAIVGNFRNETDRSLGQCIGGRFGVLRVERFDRVRDCVESAWTGFLLREVDREVEVISEPEEVVGTAMYGHARSFARHLLRGRSSGRRQL